MPAPVVMTRVAHERSVEAAPPRTVRTPDGPCRPSEEAAAWSSVVPTSEDHDPHDSQAFLAMRLKSRVFRSTGEMEGGEGLLRCNRVPVPACQREAMMHSNGIRSCSRSNMTCGSGQRGRPRPASFSLRLRNLILAHMNVPIAAWGIERRRSSLRPSRTGQKCRTNSVRISQNRWPSFWGEHHFRPKPPQTSPTLSGIFDALGVVADQALMIQPHRRGLASGTLAPGPACGPDPNTEPSAPPRAGLRSALDQAASSAGSHLSRPATDHQQDADAKNHVRTVQFDD